MIRAYDQLFSDFFDEPLLSILVYDVVDGYSIDSSTSLVAFDSSPCFPNDIFPINLVVECMKPSLWIFLGGKI
jgi:hypothetical protein